MESNYSTSAGDLNGLNSRLELEKKSAAFFVVKRVFDILLSLIGLVILSPIFLITSIAIYVEDYGPAFFVQERNGLGGEVFRMYKFRSMCKDASAMHQSLLSENELDGPAFKLKDDPRITKVGKFIRKTSIDELPQLLNIIKGEMSIVGPRPLPTYETAELNEYQRQRMLVKPGLTCYWQCSGRNDIPFDEWMELDIKYIKEASVFTDLKIILKTFKAVIGGGGRVLKHGVKRGFDLIVSLIACVVFIPVFVVVILAILLEDGAPVFYVQSRVGRNHKIFNIYKFRSMRKGADKIHEQMRAEAGCEEISFKLKTDPRVTKVGNFIRKFNIDELPQLINILKGDMSIVGPRPLPVYEYEEERKTWGDKYSARYTVPQGLTCTWQISNRADVSFERRMEMDCEYAKENSLVKDFELIIKTFLYTVIGKAEY